MIVMGLRRMSCLDSSYLIDMLKDAIVDHRLPVQNMLAVHADGGMTPGQVGMTPYDTNSPAWLESNFKGESAAFSPLAVTSGDDSANFSLLPYGQSPLVQPELAECFAYVALCPACRCYFTIRYITVCDVAVLRSKPRGYIPYLLADFACTQSRAAGLLANESSVFPYITFILTYVTPLQPTVPVARTFFNI